MPGDVFGIIAPHPPIMVPDVGRQRSDVTSDSSAAMERAAEMLRAFDPDTVVVMSPHSPAVADAIAVDTAEMTEGDLGDFGAPQLRLEYRVDTALAVAILETAAAAGVAAVDRALAPMLAPGHLDHGVLVPMSFLDFEGRWPVVVLSLSYLPLETHRRFGETVAEAARSLGRRVAFLASGDCSHRLTPDAPAGFSPRGADFDARLVEKVREGDLAGLVNLDPGLVDAAGECGLRSFVTLGGFMPDPETRVLAYEGPWGVGYLTAVAAPGGELEPLLAEGTASSGAKGGTPGDEEGVLPALARRAIESYVRAGVVIEPESLDDPELPARAGVFVSLHRDGQLRGCMGTICPTQDTLAAEVVRMALEAATADPRFPALSVEELGDLDIKVDVLHDAEACEMGDLDPETYGVIVSCDWRRGLLLPDLDGVETADDQVSIAMRKAGIAPGEQFRLERFKVDRHS